MPSQESKAAQTEPSLRRGAPTPPKLKMTAVRTRCRQEQVPHPNPTRAVPGREPGSALRPWQGPTTPWDPGGDSTAKPSPQPARTLSHLLRAEPRHGPPPGPTLLPRPSLDRARPKEGESPPGGSGAEPGGAAAPGAAQPPRDPRAPGSSTSFCSSRPSATAPRLASAAPQRRRRLTGSSLRRAPRIKPAPKALRDANELTGTTERHGGLYRTAVRAHTNAPLVRTVRGSELKAIHTGNEREATRGWGASRGLTPNPSCGALVKLP